MQEWICVRQRAGPLVKECRQKFIADEEYHISLLKKALKEYEDSDDEPKKCKSVTVII